MKFTAAPHTICNIRALLEIAFVGCLESLHSIRKSELGLGGEGEESFVLCLLCSLTSFAGLLALSAFPS